MAGEPQAVGGVSVPLTLDPSGWSAGLKRARADLDAFKRDAAGVMAPAGRASATGGRAGVPLGVVAQPGQPAGVMASVGSVRPQFAVTMGAVRDMRVEINRQLRHLSSQGEMVAVPIKLGRVPFGAMRREIAAGIGEVPIRVILDATSLSAIRGQLVATGAAVGQSSAGGPVAPVIKRATGGPVSPHQTYFVNEKRGEFFRPTVPGRIDPVITGSYAHRRPRSEYWDSDRLTYEDELNASRERAARQRMQGGRVPAARFGRRVAPLPPGQSMPPALGTAPLREGYVRGFHGTKPTWDPSTQSNVRSAKENLDRIRAQGLRVNQGIGRTYGEPDAMWFANGTKAFGDYDEAYAVEAHLPERWFGRGSQRRRSHDPYTIGGPSSNMAVMGNISRRRFASYNEPWMRHYRYMDEAVSREGNTPGRVMRQFGGTLSHLRKMNDQRRAQTPGILPYEAETQGWDQFVAESWRSRKRAGGGSVDAQAYADWALERDRKMGGLGRIKVTPDEARIAGRGMVNLRALRREGLADPARLKEHREFYDIERANIEAEARRIKVSGRQLVDVAAAVSSNQPWERNVEQAVQTIRAVKTGAAAGFANREQLETTAAILSGKRVTGVKRLPFAEAFYDPNAFPVDRWMGRITTLGERSGSDPSTTRMSLMQALRGRDWSGKDVPTPAQRRASVFGIEQMAQEWGISPREAQAEPWGVVRDLAKEAVQHFRLDKASGLAVPRTATRSQKLARGGRARIARDFAMKPLGSTMAAGGTGFDTAFGARESDAQGWDAIIRKHKLVSSYEADKLYGFIDPETMAPPRPAIPWMQDETTARDVAARMSLGRMSKKSWRMAAGGPTVGGGFCTVCRRPMRNRYEHSSTAQHRANQAGGSRGSGDWLKGGRPSWMTSMGGYDDEGYEEKVTSYPGGKWAPGLMAGGPAYKPVAPEVFHRRVGMAAMQWYQHPLTGKRRKLGETVYVYPLDEYREMKTYLDASGSSGYAIKPDGDLVSVFNAGEKGAGTGKRIMRSAIQRGASKLDAFDEDGFLPNLYSRFGFRETGRDPWNPEYAPPGWRGGEPDVVYMQRLRRRKLEAGGYVGLYRGGPTLSSMYKNMDLSAYGRRDRLEAGKALHSLGQAYPYTASKTRVKAVDDDGILAEYGVPKHLRKDQYGRLAGLTVDVLANQKPMGYPQISLNRDMDAKAISGIPGTIAKSIEDMVVHEFGHAVDFVHGLPSKSSTARSMAPVSPYGQGRGVDLQEKFAELFLQDWQLGGGKKPIHELVATLRGSDQLGGETQRMLRRRPEAPGQQSMKLAKGGPVVQTFNLADPNGLHMRPASGLIRAIEQAGVNVRVENLTNGQSLSSGTSMMSWLALSARKGHELQVTAEGAGARAAMKKIGELMRFDPEKAGIGYSDFQRSLGVGNAFSAKVDADQARLRKVTVPQPGQGFDLADPVMAQELAEQDAFDRRKLAGGGEANRGLYIVNEIGREKFVPKSHENLIPLDVAEQLPEGKGLAARLRAARGEDVPEPWKPVWMRNQNLRGKDLTGRAAGGPTEIEGHGARLWQAPDDGWVIPARLAGKVPMRHTGGPVHEHPHRGPDGRYISDREMDQQLGVRDTWRGAMFGNRQMPRFGGGGGDTWRGAMFGTGPRDSIRDALSGLFGRGSTSGSAPITSTPPPTPQAPAAPTGYPDFAAAVASRQRPMPVGPLSLDQLVESRGRAGALAELSRAQAASVRADLPRGNANLTFDEQGNPQFGGLDVLAQQQRVAQGEVRGLTGRAGLGGLVASKLGGGARREAAIRGQSLLRSYGQMGPRGAEPGTDPIEGWLERLNGLKSTFEEMSKETTILQRSGEGAKDKLMELSKAMEENQRAQGLTQDAARQAMQTRTAAEKEFKKAAPSGPMNVLALTGAGFLYSGLSQALAAGGALISESLKPFIDAQTGFQSVATRVTQELAAGLPQAGRLDTLMAQRGVAAGLSGQTTTFLQDRLGPGVYAKAGGAAAGQASEMFRAAMSTGGPSGLYGGYGGLLGTGFAAQLMGGGKGFAEQIAGDVSVSRGQPGTPGLGGDLIESFQRGVGKVVETFGENQRGVNPETSGEYQRVGGMDVKIIGVDNQVQREILNNFNQAASRARVAQGGGFGARLEDVGIGSAAAQRVLEIPGIDDYTKQMAEAGVVFKNASGEVITGLADIQKAYALGARGFTIPDQETFARTQAQQLRAQRQVLTEQTRNTLGVEIPGQLGQQLAAQPFTPAGTGIASGSKAPLGASTLASLRETDRLQSQLTAEGKQGIQIQRQFIQENTGFWAANDFSGYMQDVTNLGQQIADITASISNRQAQVSYASYANNIRLINRSIADARGLQTGRGGSLGAIQRQQFDLGRQSQQLSMQSQRLQLQSNELQLQMSQRQINFQTAIAGFQAPGITGQERAARMEEAQLEASFAQKQLDIGKQQQGLSQQQLGITGQQFGLELKAFTESARRGVIDLEAQRGLMIQQFALEQEQIAAQRRITVLTAKQGNLQSKASAIFAEASGNFNLRLQSSAQYVAMFGGTIAAAVKAIYAVIGSRGGTAPQARGRESGETQYGATGLSQYVTRPTTFVAGDAGGEQVYIIKNPTSGSVAPAGNMGGGGGGLSIQIDISGNSFGSGMDPNEIARELVDQVVDRLGTKARLVGVSA